ncbi:hypothetical protein SNE25_21360 [Mucilaginibacter sabulilitoris]|uniref:Uncharacterized protein n=1 Tax=Mucilaginibacter sabulilitoris TaxID=1173583 RepID=A0ABZ0TI63_9SPHI|nr:hypothetical protein [Mucilaginibacter sabulilitoris]WPU91868.1 hypothetical protein SNE25_21360 [Mucilaginibacter sabulilitoris]
MLQILIDPSMLTGVIQQSPQETNETGVEKPWNCEVSITIAGCAWFNKEDPTTIRDFASAEEFQDFFYPWRWAGEKPTHIRVNWLNNENDPFLPVTDLELIDNSFDSFNADAATVSKSYEDCLTTKIIQGTGQGTIAVSKDDVILNYEEVTRFDPGAPSKEHINSEIVITGQGSELHQSHMQTGYSGFLSSRMAQFAQKNCPINAALNLVFFAKGENLSKLETLPTGFIAYPVNLGNVHRRWKNPSAQKIDDIKYRITYDAGPNMQLVCPITPLPQKSAADTPIRLRDDNGDYLGYTDVSVYDAEDLLNKLVFKEKLIRKAISIFDSPSLFYDYLSHNAPAVSNIGNIADLQVFYENVNKILLGLMRDRYNLENPLNQNNTGLILDGLTPGQASGNLKDTDFSKGLIKLYNEKARELNLNLIAPGSIDAVMVNSAGLIRSEGWEAILKGYEAVEKAPPKFTDGAVEPDSVQKWLSCWKTLVVMRDLEANKQTMTAQFRSRILNVFNSLFTGETQQAARSLFEGITLEFFKYYSAGNLLIESILLDSNKNDAESQFNSDDTADIKNTLINTCLTAYLLNRKDKSIFSSINDELQLIDPLNIVPWNGLKGFLFTYDFNSATSAVRLDLDELTGSLLKHPADLPPNVLIKVDSLDTVPSGGAIQDDLSNEIAGHLLLMRRSKNLHVNVDELEEWRALNWSRINLNDMVNKKTLPLINDYLVPSFLPEADNLKTTHLTLSNERLSLIAGHDTFDENGANADHTANFTFSYLFENKIGNNGSTHTATIPPAYALWYGYNYNFAGFVALNSGVIPKVLRGPNAGNWVMPSIGKNEVTSFKTYKHLRRVAVTQPSTIVQAANDNKLAPLPLGLLPLACELPEWFAGNDDKGAGTEKNLPIYLLYDNNKGGTQRFLEIKVGKPMTNFWNWYAWNGCNLISDQGKTQLKTVLSREITVRGSNNLVNEYLHDPALSNDLVIVVEQLFPFKADKKPEYFKLTLDQGIPPAPPGEINITPIPPGLIRIEMVANIQDSTAVKFITTDNITGNKKIEIPEGYVVRVSIHGLTRREYFAVDTSRFHPWMKTIVNALSSLGDELPGDYLTQPTQLIFEAAMKPFKKQDADTVPLIEYDNIWKDIIPAENPDHQVILDMEKKSIEYAYFSRYKVSHQVWHWNGRLAGDLLKYYAEMPPAIVTSPPNLLADLNPVHGGQTNFAMKWEAWEFSDRPDFSALENTGNLKAARINRPAPSYEKQTLFTDNRPADDKALYYRFKFELFSRYELLGGDYIGSLISEIKISDRIANKDIIRPNQWKRYIRPSRKPADSILTKPVIRFVIPLTASIDECSPLNEIGGAPLMIVVNDRWFSELGLAEKLEVGIELQKYDAKDQPSEYYLNGGPDPILSGSGLAQVTLTANTSIEYPIPPQGSETNPYSRKNPVAVFLPEGPAGLTFDMATATPKLLGATFILKAEHINKFLSENAEVKMGAWSMVQISARRSINKAFWDTPSADAPEIKSEWTAGEWVQLLPDTNSLIPSQWKKEHANYGFVKLKAEGSNLRAIQDFIMPVLKADVFTDQNKQVVLESKTEKYLIISENVTNAGGLPTEVYRATYHYKGGNIFILNDPHKDGFSPDDLSECFARIIVVRVTGKTTDESKSLWEMLFGENIKRTIPFGEIQEDPAAALPLISKRISVTITH